MDASATSISRLRVLSRACRRVCAAVLQRRDGQYVVIVKHFVVKAMQKVVITNKSIDVGRPHRRDAAATNDADAVHGHAPADGGGWLPVGDDGHARHDAPGSFPVC